MTVEMWLKSGQDYAAGCALYARLGGSEAWKKVLAAGPTDYNRAKLRELMAGLAETKSKRAAGQIEAAPERAQPLVEKLRAEWKPLYKRMAHLHAQLVHLPEKERGVAALEILELDERINKIWEVERHVVRTGRLPESKAEAETGSDPSAMLKRLLNLRVRISKHRNNESRRAEVMAWEAEKSELERKLKNA